MWLLLMTSLTLMGKYTHRLDCLFFFFLLNRTAYRYISPGIGDSGDRLWNTA